MRFKIFLLFLLLVFSINKIIAQSTQYQFSHLTISNGLLHNGVTAILKDKKGFMWFGTMAGLNRYDGYKFKSFKHDPRDTSSLGDDFIVNIFEAPNNKLCLKNRTGLNFYDQKTEKFTNQRRSYLSGLHIPGRDVMSLMKDKTGNFLFLTPTGVYRYNPRLKNTDIVYTNKSISAIPDAVQNLAVDSRNNIWMITLNGILQKFDINTKQITYRLSVSGFNFNKPRIYAVFLDKDDDVWLYASNFALGVYYINTTTNAIKHFEKANRLSRLNSDKIDNIIQDDKGLLWIATDHGGINLLDKKDFSIKYLVNREDDAKSISQNSVISMYKDSSGIIWLGTYKKGVNYYHENIIKFPLIHHYSSDPNSLSYDDVNVFAEDAKGNLWIGTNGAGLVYYDRKSNKFSPYKHSLTNKNTVCNDVIVSLYIDRDKKLWIGTYLGGLDCYDGKTFTHYKHNDTDTNSLSNDCVYGIIEDSEKSMWVGTLGGGLNRLDKQSKTFYHYRHNQKNAIHSDFVMSMLESKAGDIWLRTPEGIDVISKKTGKLLHYFHDDKNSNSLVHNNVSSFFIDSRGWLWAGTREGLSILNLASGKFTNFKKEDGLPNNMVLGILEDNSHNIWLSTAGGLSNVVLTKNKDRLSFSFKNYDESDGLQGLEFNENSAFKTSKDELIFGGANGFNIFDPSNIKPNKNKSDIVLTDLQVLNKSLSPGQEINGNIILPKSITETDFITLPHNENVFSIEFAALDFFDPDKAKLQYMLDGFDKDWLTADNKVRKATYTNLDAGTYTFKVKNANYDGIGNAKKLFLKIKVLPPFWKTPYAYIAYLIMLAGTLLYIRGKGIKKISAQFAVEQERQEAQRMHELDMMKIKFFTNVSHEFRTPLALILAPVDKILKQVIEPDQRKQLQIVNQNARRLLNLVNQLLDFRKMEVHELKLHTTRGDIIAFIQEISESFTDVAEKKNIGFLFDSETDSLQTEFDHDKIERILFNLLSNSFKFTPEHGHVSVLLNLVENSQTVEKNLEIKVIDTGIGIPLDKHDKIFDRFFQNDIPGSMVNQGSGIGLAITKEFVKLHNGTIRVESEPEQGSCFIVSLPVKNNISNTTKTQDVKITSKESETVLSPALRNEKKQTVLIIEDNDDFRFYLKDNLKGVFNIIEAVNGKEGWQKALALHPNLVVSDISMPEMNGIDLCRKIKADPRTSHLPVILLTAITGEEQQIKGLETGATDYLTKPFNFEILLSKIKNILFQQESIRKTYQKQVKVLPSEVTSESPDTIFIQKALQIIDKNIPNPNFSVEELSSEMFVSRVTLYNKMLLLTGKSPVELIRSLRLKRAAQLIEKGHLTISQIAYKVGFKSQKYFVKSFKAEYNTIPSAYLNNKAPQV